MKLFLSLFTALLFLVFISQSNAAPSNPARTLTDLKVIPTRVLKRSISPKFYQSLTISPVKGWIIVRATLSGTHLSGARVIHSELGGTYDGLALQRAREVLISANYS